MSLLRSAGRFRQEDQDGITMVEVPVTVSRTRACYPPVRLGRAGGAPYLMPFHRRPGWGYVRTWSTFVATASSRRTFLGQRVTKAVEEILLRHQDIDAADGRLGMSFGDVPDFVGNAEVSLARFARSAQLTNTFCCTTTPRGSEAGRAHVVQHGDDHVGATVVDHITACQPGTLDGSECDILGRKWMPLSATGARNRPLTPSKESP